MKAHVQKVTHSRETSWVYRVKADRRFTRGWHFHPEFELTYIQASQGRRLVGDSIENYRGGDLIFLGPNLPHTWRSVERPDQGSRRRRLHRAIVIQFAESFLGASFFQLPELEGVARLLARASRGLRILGETRDEVARRMQGMGRLERFQRLLELLRVLGILSRGGKDVQVICKAARGGIANRDDRRRVDRVLNQLHDRYTAPVAQAAVAASVGLSPAGFSRFFKKTTGMRFVDYLGELRISHACDLLMDTDDSVLEISLRSGFNNLSNFNRKFVRLKGVTPRAYRHQHEAASSRT